MSTFVSTSSSRSRAKILLLLAGLAGAMAAGVAGAADAGDAPPSVTVKYSQETLATNDGVRDLYRRIAFAAKQVCPEIPTKDLAAQQRAARCREHAVEQAVRQIGNTQLAALHASHSKNG